MKGKNRTQKLKNILLGITCALLITSSIILFTGFFKPFYYMTYQGDYAKPFISNVLGFFIGFNDLSKDFNKLESVHLNDVKNILYNISALWSLCLIIFFFMRTRLKILISRAAFLFAGTVLLMISIPGFICAIFFEQSFTLFHEIFFIPGTYIFDINSLIKTVFPDTYFIFAFIFIIAAMFVFGIFFVLHYFKKGAIVK